MPCAAGAAEPSPWTSARPAPPTPSTGVTRPEDAWLTPIPDGQVIPDDADPAEVAATRESIKLAFVTALQHLPARQRACLILCEVLKWQATEAAELLDTTVASVNSALQRARATLADRAPGPGDDASTVPEEQQELLARYVDAFERYDIDSLVTLLRDDAVMSMPPFDFWLQGPTEVGRFFVGPGGGCRGLPARRHRRQRPGRLRRPTSSTPPAAGPRGALQVIEVADDRIVGHHNFLDTNLFDVFGLPEHLS